MIDVEQQDGVAVFRLNHGKANVMDLEFCEALTERVEVHRGEASRALVLAGKGQIFCAGVDLLRILEGKRDYVERFIPALIKTFETVLFHPKPVVAAINGHAIAGGCVLACAADHRLMAKGAGRIGVPELLVGVPFPTVALEIMRFVVPPQELRRLLHGGGTCSAELAVQRGLADAAVEPELLLSQAVAHARTLAALPPAAFELTKRQMLRPLAERLHRDAAHFDATVRDLWASPAAMESIRDHVARTFKRPPH